MFVETRFPEENREQKQRGTQPQTHTRATSVHVDTDRRERSRNTKTHRTRDIHGQGKSERQKGVSGTDGCDRPGNGKTRPGWDGIVEVGRGTPGSIPRRVREKTSSPSTRLPSGTPSTPSSFSSTPPSTRTGSSDEGKREGKGEGVRRSIRPPPYLGSLGCVDEVPPLPTVDP